MSIDLIDLVEPLGWQMPDDEVVQVWRDRADEIGDDLNAAIDSGADDDKIDELERRYEDAKSNAEDAQETLQAWNAANNAFNRLAARARQPQPRGGAIPRPKRKEGQTYA